MARQFEIRRNTGPGADFAPYLLVVQSNRFHRLGRRLVVPLLPERLLPVGDRRLNPSFTVEERPHVLEPLDLTTVPLSALGELVADAAARADEVVAALDEALSRGWD
jgi:toxin CcdB